MVRGTTPTHIFTLPFEVSLVKDIRIIYKQYDDILLTKVKEDCTINTDSNAIEVTLTQEDTFKFRCDKKAQVQMRVKTLNDKVVITDIILLDVEECLDKEVIM